MAALDCDIALDAIVELPNSEIKISGTADTLN